MVVYCMGNASLTAAWGPACWPSHVTPSDVPGTVNPLPVSRTSFQSHTRFNTLFGNLLLSMAANHGVEPFAFEPVYEEGEDHHSSSSSDSEDGYLYNTDSTVRLHHPSTAGRVAMTLGEWCQCGSCSSDGLTDLECICCTEWQLLESRLGADNIQCVTQHQDVATLCLNPVVLLSMWPYIMAFKNLKGPIPRQLTNR